MKFSELLDATARSSIHAGEDTARDRHHCLPALRLVKLSSIIHQSEYRGVARSICCTYRTGGGQLTDTGMDQSAGYTRRQRCMYMYASALKRQETRRKLEA